MTMPLRKYKGKPVSDLPTKYLVWLSEIELREPLLSAVDEALDGRDLSQDEAPTPDPVVLHIWPGDIPLVRTIVDRGFKAVAGSRHPDRGGSTEEMVHFNAVPEALRYQLDNAQESR